MPLPPHSSYAPPAREGIRQHIHPGSEQPQVSAPLAAAGAPSTSSPLPQACCSQPSKASSGQAESFNMQFNAFQSNLRSAEQQSPGGIGLATHPSTSAAPAMCAPFSCSTLPKSLSPPSLQHELIESSQGPHHRSAGGLDHAQGSQHGAAGSPPHVFVGSQPPKVAGIMQCYSLSPPPPLKAPTPLHDLGPQPSKALGGQAEHVAPFPQPLGPQPSKAASVQLEHEDSFHSYESEPSPDQAQQEQLAQVSQLPAPSRMSERNLGRHLMNVGKKNAD